MAGRVRGFRATAVGAVCLMVVGFGLGGCTPDEEPTPSETTTSVTEEPSTETASPTPTETPTLTTEEVNVEAAKQTVIEYYAAVDEVARSGFSTWAENLAPFWGTAEVANEYGQLFQQAATQDLRAEGSTVITDLIVVEPGVDSTADRPRVQLEFCEDTAGITLYTPTGTAVPKAPEARALWHALLEQQPNLSWAFSQLHVLGDRQC